MAGSRAGLVKVRLIAGQSKIETIADQMQGESLVGQKPTPLFI